MNPAILVFVEVGRLRGILGAIVVLIASRSFANGTQSPFHFLERFHPRHFPIDLQMLLGPGSYPGSKFSILVFSPKDRAALLRLMKRELRRKLGYEITNLEPGWDDTGRRLHAPKSPDCHWIFLRTRDGVRDVLELCSGRFGVHYERNYLQNKVTPPIHSADALVVGVRHEEAPTRKPGK